MVALKTIADPKSHYGNGKHATRAFKVQRLTGAISIFFTGFFIWLLVRLMGASHAEMVSVIAHPVVAVLLVLLIVVVCAHMRIGMQEVIDDYVETPASHKLAGAANIGFAALVTLIGVVSIAKLVFWG
jgi:succinate dehydrogenase / fumarate reductase membrane anchor subunit